MNRWINIIYFKYHFITHHSDPMWLVWEIYVYDLPTMSIVTSGARDELITEGYDKAKPVESRVEYLHRGICNWTHRVCCWGCLNRMVCWHNLNDQSVRKLSTVLQSSFDDYGFEQYIVSKAMALLSSDNVDEEGSDEKYPIVESPVDKGNRRPSDILRSNSNLVFLEPHGHKCSYVRRAQNGKLLLLRRSFPDESTMGTLANVNALLQIHIDRAIIVESFKKEIPISPTPSTTNHSQRGRRFSSGEVNPEHQNNGSHRPNGGDSRRSSVLGSGTNQSIQSLGIRSSEILTPTEKDQGLDEFSKMTAIDLLDRLPLISEVIKDELNFGNGAYKRHADMLLELFKANKKMRKIPVSEDRWFALLYTDHGIKADGNHFHVFQYLVVRLILLTYCVAFEERDVSSADILKEFFDRFQSSDTEIRLPFVFSKGVSVGSFDVIYNLHYMRQMPKIFQGNILSPEMYLKWRQRTPFDNSKLSLRVPSLTYPKLHEFLGGKRSQRKKSLSHDNFTEFNACVNFVKRSVEVWEFHLAKEYCQPDLRIYVLLKGTIQRSLAILEVLLDKAKLNSSRSSTSSRRDSDSISSQKSGHSITSVESKGEIRKALDNDGLPYKWMPPQTALLLHGSERRKYFK